MARTRTQVSPTGAQTGPAPAPVTRTAERVTVNLSQRSSAALEQAAKITGDTKTEVINKALQLWEMVQTAQAAGGALYIQEAKDGEPTRATFF